MRKLLVLRDFFFFNPNGLGSRHMVNLIWASPIYDMTWQSDTNWGPHINIQSWTHAEYFLSLTYLYLPTLDTGDSQTKILTTEYKIYITHTNKIPGFI